MKTKFALDLACIGAIALCVSAARADMETLISNYPNVDPIAITPLNGGAIKAMGFTVGAVSFDIATLTLHVANNSSYGNRIIEASLYSNSSSNTPGIKLMTFESHPLGIGTPIQYDIVLTPKNPPFNTFRAIAGTTYWLVVRSYGPAAAVWSASNPNKTPSGIASHFGALWNAGDGTLPTIPSTTLNSYRIQGLTRANFAWYLQDPTTGQIGVATYDYSHFINWKTFPQVVGSAWEVLAFGNFGGSIHGDAFLRNKSTGQLAFWYANNSNFFQFVNIPQMPPSVWQFKGVARFGSTIDFPVYQNPQSGVVVVGAHNGNQITQWRIFPKVPNPAWEIVAVGDTNSNGYGDVLFRNKTTGQLAVWRTDGFDFTTWHVLPQVPSAAWDIVDINFYENQVIFRHKTTRDFAAWQFNGAGTALIHWMPLAKQPDSKFEYKGFGQISTGADPN